MSSTGLVAFVPGNGHVDARLDPARAALRELGVERRFDLRSIDYGAAASFDELLRSVRAQVADASLVYATGIGGLVVLALRANGELLDRPMILQGPVLWGLETRRFPRWMRIPGMPHALVMALRTSWIRRRFERKHFEAPLQDEMRRAFFEGYDDAGAFARWFRWLTPGLLRDLETKLRGRADRVQGLIAWWGDRDHVVGIDELRRTEAALALEVPLRRFASWGHYPMIDDPHGWVHEVSRALEAAALV